MTKPTDVGSSYIDSLKVSNQPKLEKPRNELGQKEFFDLMIAQLQNQDPMKPMESSEFLGQVAQFSTVSGIQEMQESFSSLATAMQSSQALQASTLVGREVLVPGDHGRLADGGSLHAAVDLPSSTRELVVGVHGEDGELVHRIDLGQQPAGLVSFQWDGTREGQSRLPAGNYRITAAYSEGDSSLAAETLVAAHVDSVSLGRAGQQTQLNLTGGDTIGLNQVRQIM